MHDSDLAWILPPLKCNSIEDGITSASVMCPSVVESSCSLIQDPSVLVLGMSNIDYSCLDSLSNYIISTPNKIDTHRLPSYSMLGMQPNHARLDSGAVLRGVCNDCMGKDSASHIEFTNNIKCVSTLYVYVCASYTSVM